MREIIVSYDNSDGLFYFDQAIRESMNWWAGEEIDSGQDLETGTRSITFAVADEGNDSIELIDMEDRICSKKDHSNRR